MELTLISINAIILICGLYLAYQNQKEINKHRDFIKSLENDLRVNLKGNLVVKGSDIHKELERTLSRNKRVLDNKFPSNSLPRVKNQPPPPERPINRPLVVVTTHLG